MPSPRTRVDADDRKGNETGRTGAGTGRKGSETGRSRRHHTTTDHDGDMSIRSLQRSLGNQAVQELLRRGELKPHRPLNRSTDRVGEDIEEATELTERAQDPTESAPESAEVSPGEPDDAITDRGVDVDAPVDVDTSVERVEETQMAEQPGEQSPSAAAAEDTAASSPIDDPEFQTVVDAVETVAARQRSHPPPEATSAEAQQAAESPPEEVTSEAAANQVDEMARQEPGPFDREALKETLLHRIEATAPETLEDADEFADSNDLDAVTSDVVGEVDAQTDRSQGPIEEATTETPDTAGVEPRSATPMEPPDVGAPPPDVGAARAVPGPKPDAEVVTPFQERSNRIEQQFEDGDLTQKQLESANESRFTSALDAKRDAQTHANQAPTEYRQDEQRTLSEARAEAETVAGSELQSMHGGRSKLLDAVVGRQVQTKSEDERTRAEIAADIQEIYEETTQRVTERLDALERQVGETFEEGAERARSIFETYVDERMRAYKAERYSGRLGLVRWSKDKLLGLPSEVEQFYADGRDRYLSEMDATIDQVVDVLETGLTETREIIVDGRQTVEEYVTDLPESLRAVGQEAASDIKHRFDELERQVEDRKDQMIDSLAQQYTESLQAVDDRIEELHAENRGLVDSALDAVGDVVRTIAQLKNLLLGVLSKASAAVTTIIQDPIGFLGNLVEGVAQGLDNFRSNIWTHLQTGLIEWLTGTIAEAGIQLPERFDLEGIFTLVMQILGLTYENIRSRAVSVLGEEAVSTLEKTFEIFEVLVTEGVAGLWTYVQTTVGDLKAMVLDRIRELVITQVIEAGIRWIIGLLGPVGAFIKACKAIYEVVSFFVQRAREVLALVEAVLDSVLDIAQGNLGGAATRVEDALARSIPILIGFLAALLSLGDLPDRIRSVIQTVQDPINEGIQWVLEQARVAAKRVGTAIGVTESEQQKEAEVREREDVSEEEEEDRDRDERTPEDKRRDVDAAMADAEDLLRDPERSPTAVQAALPGIKAAYGLTSIDLFAEQTGETSGLLWVEGAINPESTTAKLPSSHSIDPDRETVRQWRKIGGKTMTRMEGEGEIFAVLWDDAAKPADQALIDETLAGESKRLQQRNAKWAKTALEHLESGRREDAAYVVASELYDLHRDRFWNRVRKHAGATAFLESAGWTVGSSGVPTNTFTGDQLTIEHQRPRKSAPSLALRPDNLLFSPRPENETLIRLIRDQLPDYWQ